MFTAAHFAEPVPTVVVPASFARGLPSVEDLAHVRRTWRTARADAALFDRVLGDELRTSAPALVLLLPGGDLDAAVAALVHAVDVAVQDLARLHALAARAPAPPVEPAADPIGAALVHAVAACAGSARVPDAARVAWWATWRAIGTLAAASRPVRAAA